MIAIQITFAILFSFLLFVGAFWAISTLIFDKVEISDHMEKVKLQEVKERSDESMVDRYNRNSKLHSKQRDLY